MKTKFEQEAEELESKCNGLFTSRQSKEALKPISRDKVRKLKKMLKEL